MAPLNAASLAEARPGTRVPGYDRAAIRPGIVHIGLGNFHRAHQAAYLDDLMALDEGARAFGIVGVNLLPGDERTAATMREQDGLYTLLERPSDGTIAARVVGSVVQTVFAPDEPERALEAMTCPDTRIVSLTITEGGYHYDAATGAIDLDAPELVHDLENPGEPRTAFGYLAEALRRRRSRGTPPFTVMSCDNIHANGDLTCRVLAAVAGAQDPEFGRWLADHVAFPNSMVDRITPRTTDADVADAARRTGLHDGWPVSCEPFRQWVLEDRFGMGRPRLERVGVQVVADVRPYELMKMRLLNAGHQAIAYAGRLLGHRTGWEACRDGAVRDLLRRYQLTEAVHTLPEIPGVDLQSYCATLGERFGNPHIGDSMERLCYQPSTMLATFVLPVVRDLLAAGRGMLAATAVVACWARYLEGVDDAGRPVPVVDIHAADLTARAARHDDDLLALVRDNGSFAGLADDRRFTEAYAHVLGTIRAKGTRAGLQDVFDRAG